MEATPTQGREQLPLLTASRLKDARSCQRKHRYRYVDGAVPLEDSSPLRFGTMFHTALEAWWKGEGDARLHDALQTIRLDADPFEAAMARALITGYDARWGDQTFKVLAVEAEFYTPLVNPETGAASRSWQLAGKIDVLVQDEHDRVLSIEHKTSSEDITPGSQYWKRLRLDGQVSVYFKGAKALGYDIEECLYDVIGKPQQRPLKATPVENRKFTKDGKLYANLREFDETPEEYFARIANAIGEDPTRYFARGSVVRLEAEMDEAMFDIWAIAQQLRSGMTADRFPRNPDACVSYGRTCPYFGVCSGESSLDDPLLFKKLNSVHPELSQSA